MYIVKKAFTETIKAFLFSILCSIIFALMIYRDDAITIRKVCFILNSSALLLFFYLNFRSWSKLYLEAFTHAEYFVPTLTSVFVYSTVSFLLYRIKFLYYMWLFLPTRFLEPMLTSQYAFVSFWAAQAAFLMLVFLTPRFTVGKR